MANRKTKRRVTRAHALPLEQPAEIAARKRVSPRKLWLFRCALALLVPTLFFLAAEGALRLGGYGRPTRFLLQATVNDVDSWIPNRDFAVRFFGPRLARQSTSFAIARAKPANVVRVVVLGESAAFGDPQPAFGLQRMLQALLSLRRPDVKFEVVNAAMTGINSHAIAPIARDCARADGDAWVIYMGNNEVIGPFGAGTVFGPQAPSGAIIRSSLAVKSTRVGQLLAAIEQRINQPPESKGQWGGMLMFVGNQVRRDDARMNRVYQHFERNLEAILDVAKSRGVAAVVSTVAVNLRDCAPFASLHRTSLAGGELTQWQGHFDRGMAAQNAGDHAAAVDAFRAAEDIDNGHAELVFALARSLHAMGRRDEAARSYALARDLDVLRFRCDDGLNAITRRVAAERGHDGARLVDAEKIFAENSIEGAPGAEFFYEHVHLTFEGNYLLARSIAGEIEAALADRLPPRPETVDDWPTIDDCARRLVWTDYHRLSGINMMLGRLADPPFTSESNHDEQVRRLRRQARELKPKLAQAFLEAPRLYEAALAQTPDDPVLYAQLGAMYGQSGNAEAAIPAALRAVELLPINADHWILLGASLAVQQQFQEAADAFHEAFRLDSQNVSTLYQLARCYAALDRPDDAIRQCRRAIELNSQFGTAYLELSRLLEEKGRGKEAERNLRLAAANRVNRSSDLLALAQACQNRGWMAEAADAYLQAISLSPDDAGLRVVTGQCLVAAGRADEARRQFQEAANLAPDSGEARFLWGIELGRAGKINEAVEQFREAVRLMPDVVEARINLGVALNEAGNVAEAMDQFREVLRRDPDNAVALQTLRTLEDRGGP